mmetsp:Transcript_1826/g.4013  ORF Transcript_1826/g.4013 Transcript_1826/m.4013 type:complete len:231 (-) Transcript_1826:77-769(-)|eukprot:scaffold5479_cov199-Amphora_coffeaeformis.AAC.46
MPLSGTIDQTAPLASQDGRVLDNRAPPLANGTAASLAHVRQSQREYKRRKVIQESGAGATVDEVTASRVRMVAVDMAAAFDTYGEALRGGPVTREDLDAQTETLTNTLTNSLTATLTAALAAETARRYNTIILQGVEPVKSTTPFRRIPKTTPGLMPDRTIGTPNVPSSNPSIGDRCPAELFPTNYETLQGLTRQKLDDLMTWYNNDFDIQDDDSDVQRRQKFLEFIQWG